MLKETGSEFISVRTKEALARRKAEGLPVGRPKGRATKLMLDDRREQIVDCLNKGGSANAPWRRFSAVHRPHSTRGSGADAFPDDNDPLARLSWDNVVLYGEYTSSDQSW